MYFNVPVAYSSFWDFYDLLQLILIMSLWDLVLFIEAILQAGEEMRREPRCGGVCHLGRSASAGSRGDRPGSSLLGSPMASSGQARGGRPGLSLGKSHVKVLSLPAHAIHASGVYLCVPTAALAPMAASMRIKEDQQEWV